MPVTIKDIALKAGISYSFMEVPDGIQDILPVANCGLDRDRALRTYSQSEMLGSVARELTHMTRRSCLIAG